MILEIAAIIAGQIGLSSASLLAYHHFFVKKNKKSIQPNAPTPYSLAQAYAALPNQVTHTGEAGLVTEVLEDKTVYMTTDEHLKYLCSLYPEAAKVYKSDHSNKYLKSISDRYILRLIIAAEEGQIPVKITPHQMEFGNGDKIWISNKYYAYGNLSASSDNPQCRFETSGARVSLYTFLRIVNLEETHFDPVLKFNNKVIKVL